MILYRRTPRAGFAYVVVLTHKIKQRISPDAQRIAMSQRTKFIPRTAYFIMLTGEHQTEYGELAERSKAAVLKTVVVKATWGSNP